MRQNNTVWCAKTSSICTTTFHTYHRRRILYQICCVSVLTTIWHTQEDLEQLEMKPIFVDQHLNAWWLIHTVSTCRAILAHILQTFHFYDIWSHYRIHIGPTSGVCQSRNAKDFRIFRLVFKSLKNVRISQLYILISYWYTNKSLFHSMSIFSL